MSDDNFFNFKDTSSIIFPDNSICSFSELMELAAHVFRCSRSGYRVTDVANVPLPDPGDCGSASSASSSSDSGASPSTRTWHAAVGIWSPGEVDWSMTTVRVYGVAAPPAGPAGRLSRQMSALLRAARRTMPKRVPEPDPLPPPHDDEDSEFADESIPGEDEDEEEDDAIDEEEEEMVTEKEIVVDFEAFPPEECDFQGIKKLLHQLFLKEDVSTSDMTNLLISTPELTTVLKQVEDDEEDENDEPDEEVYGIISLIDLRQSAKTSCSESLRKFIIEHASKSKNEKFEEAARSALTGKSALVVNERFINLPARISLPCFESLVQDLKKKPHLDFDHFFMIIKVQKAMEEKTSSSKKKGDVKRQKVDRSAKNQTGAADDAAGILFQNPEEEIFCEKAEQWMEFSVANQCDEEVRSGNWDEEDVKYRPFRRILLLSSERFLAAIAQLEHEFSGPAS